MILSAKPLFQFQTGRATLQAWDNVALFMLVLNETWQMSLSSTKPAQPARNQAIAMLPCIKHTGKRELHAASLQSRGFV